MVPWTPQEDELLLGLVGQTPLLLIPRKYRRAINKTELPPRTGVAITSRIYKIGKASGKPISVKCLEDNFPCKVLADALGICPKRVRYWVCRNGLKATQLSNGHYMVKRSDAVKFALENPRRFSDVDEIRLFWLLESWSLVEQINSSIPTGQGRSRHKKKIRRSDGKVYESIADAEKDNYLSNGAIQQAIRNNGKSAGYKWEFVD